MSEAAYQLLARGLEFLDTGHPHQAILFLRRAKLLEPEKASIREALGRAHSQVGQWHEARREFTKVVAISPADDYAHFALGLACARTGERTRAIAHLKLAVAMSPREQYRRALKRLVS